MAKRKKKRRGGRYLVGAVCCAAIIGLAWFLPFDGLGFGDGFGFGTNSDDSGYSTNDDSNGNGDSAEQDGGNESAASQVVIVRGDSISHNGVDVSLDELSTIIANYSGAAWELRGEQAIAAVIDDVQALLRDHGVDYTMTSN